MKFRWMVWNGMKKYVQVWKFSKITYWYILVCTGMTDITVYHGIWPFITVYDGMKWLKQVHTSTYKYIIVYDCFRTVSNLHTGTYWYIIVTWTYILWSTGPCCQCTRLARLKAADLLLRKDTPVHTHTRLFKFGSDYLPSSHLLPVGAGRKCLPWAAPPPTLHCKILRPTGISAMLHWCSRSSFEQQ